jgi:hypothetical protein
VCMCLCACISVCAHACVCVHLCACLSDVTHFPRDVWTVFMTLNQNKLHLSDLHNNRECARTRYSLVCSGVLA